MSFTYQDLGWSTFFMNQQDAGSSTIPYRVCVVHRARLTGLCPDGAFTLTPPADQATGEFAVGDWVLCDDDRQVVQLLDRQTTVSRRSAGTHMQEQLIAANVDVLFITTSCNADFNPARLERYLALASQTGCYPVVVLTKADMCDDPGDYTKRAEALAPMLTVLTIDAHNADDLAQVAGWCSRGQTAALVGSSGVGKTTLANGLTGAQDATAGIREDDAHGRHTTTVRALRPMINGGWLIDTPGMRALRLFEASDGIDSVFADLVDLAQACRYRDCSHETEPGCAVRAAIAAGEITSERLGRWQKLRLEDQHNSETLVQSRARDKALGKMIRSVHKSNKTRRGR